MSSEESDLSLLDASMLDLLAFNCGDLSEKIWECKSEEAKNKLVLDYLSKTDVTNHKPIDDFTEGK
jgi:hypothetical protein